MIQILLVVWSPWMRSDFSVFTRLTQRLTGKIPRRPVPSLASLHLLCFSRAPLIWQRPCIKASVYIIAGDLIHGRGREVLPVMELRSDVVEVGALQVGVGLGQALEEQLYSLLVAMQIVGDAHVQRDLGRFAGLQRAEAEGQVQRLVGGLRITLDLRDNLRSYLTSTS